MSSIALVARVVNMLRFSECIILWFFEWSTCLDSINLFLYVGFESGQHVEIPPMFSIALDPRVVNRLRFHE